MSNGIKRRPRYSSWPFWARCLKYSNALASNACWSSSKMQGRSSGDVSFGVAAIAMNNSCGGLLLSILRVKPSLSIVTTPLLLL